MAAAAIVGAAAETKARRCWLALLSTVSLLTLIGCGGQQGGTADAQDARGPGATTTSSLRYDSERCGLASDAHDSVDLIAVFDRGVTIGELDRTASALAADVLADPVPVQVDVDYERSWLLVDVTTDSDAIRHDFAHRLNDLPGAAEVVTCGS
jgi:hypothetical protein